jgi:hypothetical protein
LAAVLSRVFDGSPAASPSRVEDEASAPFPRDSLGRFTAACAGTALLLLLLWVGLRNPRTEAADKLYFLSALAVGVAAFFSRITSRLGSVLAAGSVLGFGIMLWGVATVEHQNLVNTLWLGFGRVVLVATLGGLPVVGWLLRPDVAIAPRYRSVGYGVLSLVMLLGALSFIQTRTSLSQPDHSGYVFNELYAVAAGHFPYTDFIPQYQTLFAYLFYPVIELLGPERALNPLLYLLSALSLVTVGLGVVAGWMATRGLNRLLAPLLILPLVFITQGPGRVGWGGSISALHSAYPVRMLLPALLGIAIAALPVLGVQKWHPYRQVLPLGMLIGLGCFHQIDFGAAAAIAVGTVMAVSLPIARWARELSQLGLSVGLGFVTVPLLHWLADKPLGASKIGWFVRQFGGGFGSEPIQIPGPVLVILPLLIGSTVTCLAALRAQRRALEGGSWGELGVLGRLCPRERLPLLAEAGAMPMLLPIHRAALIGSYFGVLGIAGFPYYLNRSYASGQMQILFLPLAIALCATAQIIAASPEWAENARSIRSGLLRLGLALPIASLIQLPNPAHEWDRLSGVHPETHWPSEKTASIIGLGQAWKKLGTYQSVGYFGNDGNYIESITGVHNVTRFNSPLDASMSPAALTELCSGIADPHLQTLILGDKAPNPTVCHGKWTFRKSQTGVIVASRQE